MPLWDYGTHCNLLLFIIIVTAILRNQAAQIMKNLVITTMKQPQQHVVVVPSVPRAG
jgi:hypothetical protein